jgi:putative endonuclease
VEEPWFVYVLLCHDNSFYCGISNDVLKRYQKHNAGKGARYTKARLPVDLIYQVEYENKSEAAKAEYAFKQLSRKQKEKILLSALGIKD